MVLCCCAYNCSNASDKNPELIFHSFPDAVKQRERRLEWINAVKRKNWQPTKWSKLCSAHFVASDYGPAVISGKLRLRKEAVPSVFDYLDYFQPKRVCERRPLIRITVNKPELHENCVTEPPVEVSHKNVAVQTNLTGDQLTNTLNDLRRQKKSLQEQLQRSNAHNSPKCAQ